MRTCRILAPLGALLLLAATTCPVAAWLWVQSDWAGGHFVSADGIESAAAPGELVLASDPDRLVLAFDATDAYGGIWSLVPYQGRLHMASCTTPMSDTGGELLSYDPVTHTVTFEYSAYEEGNVVLREEGGLLMSPGLDNLGSWDWGNLYLNDGSGWLRKETVPGALHVLDVAMHAGRLYATTGLGPENFEAGLLVSDDLGDTWDLVMTVPAHPPDNFFRRFYGLASWGGALWVQSDFWWPEGKVIYELRDGTTTTHTVPAGDYSLAGFASFGGRLLVLTRTLLDSWDGVQWRGLLLPQVSYNFATRALCVYRGRVYVGGREGGAWTTDLATWHPLAIENFVEKEVEAYAAFHGRLYAGTVGAGEVYVSPAVAEGILDSEPFGAPAPFGDGALEWTGFAPPGTAIAFQLRSAATEVLLASAPFLGPDGTTENWYSLPGAPIAGAHYGHQWLQWRLRLTSGDPALSPVVEAVSLELAPAEATDAPAAAFTAAPRAWPNPFASSLQLAAPGGRAGAFAIYDAKGCLARRLTAPAASALWDGRDAEGRALPAGVYLIRFETGGAASAACRVLRVR